MVKPYYTDDQVTLYHGDCLEVDAWLSADVLVTDPPYGIGWAHSFSKNAIGERWQDASKVGIANDHDTGARDAVLEAWGAKRPAICFGSLNADYPHGWQRMLVFQKPTVACGLVGNRKPWLSNWEPIFVIGDWPEQTPRRSSVIATRRPAAGGYSGYITEAGHSHAKPLDVDGRADRRLPSWSGSRPVLRFRFDPCRCPQPRSQSHWR